MVAKRGARVIIVAVLAVLGAMFVVWNAFVAAFAETQAGRAAGLWASHPSVALSAGLAHIGELAATGRPVDAGVTDPVIGIARDAPLAAEPFLVRGVELRLAGDEAAAGIAFVEARRRDPRSIASRFFLADHHLRTGAVGSGLEEVAALTRLVPGGAARIAPVLAGYALTPGAAGQVRTMLRRHPELEPALLARLARDPRNVELVLSLASNRAGPDGKPPIWQARLVQALVTSGQYARAYDQWSRFMGVPTSGPRRPLLFDPRFERGDAVAPFGWTLASGKGGLVEPDNGGLHVIYYGRDNIDLASQLLLLAPGKHELAMKVANGGEEASALAWTLTCLPSKKVILSVDLARSTAARGAGQAFEVPGSGCAAQRLKLSGKTPDYPQTVDLTLSGLTLTRGGAR